MVQTSPGGVQRFGLLFRLLALVAMASLGWTLAWTSLELPSQSPDADPGHAAYVDERSGAHGRLVVMCVVVGGESTVAASVFLPLAPLEQTWFPVVWLGDGRGEKLMMVIEPVVARENSLGVVPPNGMASVLYLLRTSNLIVMQFPDDVFDTIEFDVSGFSMAVQEWPCWDSEDD